MNKVCHVSSAHPYNDIRILKKECASLAQSGFEVFYVCNDTQSLKLNGVQIISTGFKNKSRVIRMTIGVWKVFRKSLKTKAELYHLHDPELLLLAPLYRILGKKVIFDAHEDLPAQIMDKYYLNKTIRVFFSKALSIIEKLICKNVSGCIGATPHITQKFLNINNKTVNINNYPIDGELISDSFEFKASNKICFTGSITEIRGIVPLIKAMEYCSDINLLLAGNISPTTLLDELKKMKGWSQVTYLGLVDRKQLVKIMSESFAGIVTFLPAQNHIYAQPNKMFEYMSAGLPVIGSNFELWNKILLENKCGITVSPDNPVEIANAIKYLYQNFDVAKNMSENGIMAINNQYNWKSEEQKLVSFYHSLLA